MAGIRREPARRRIAEYTGLALSVIVLAAGLVVIVARPVTAVQSATLHPLQGKVQLGVGGDEFVPGVDGATLRGDDVIRTGPDATAEVAYFDGSVTRLDHETTLILERVASIEEQRGSRLIESQLEAGRTFHRVEETADPDSHFEVEAPGVGTASAGTTFVLSKLPTGLVALWVVPDGEPELGSVELDVEDGETVTVPEGEGITVFQTGQLGASFRLTEAHLSDPWVTYNLCELDDADVEACRPDAEEPATPKPRPQKPPPAEPLSVSEDVEVPGIVLVSTQAALPGTVILGGTRGLAHVGRAKFRFAGTGPVALFECSLDGGSFTSCRSPKRYRGLDDGSHVFLVRAVDADGNAGPVARRRWRIDSEAPDTLIVGPSLASGGAAASFGFVSSEPRSEFRCRLDGGAFVSCAPPASFAGLAPGGHTFQVRAVDPAGNADPSPATYAWIAEGETTTSRVSGDLTPVGSAGAPEAEPSSSGDSKSQAATPIASGKDGSLIGAVDGLTLPAPLPDAERVLDDGLEAAGSLADTVRI